MIENECNSYQTFYRPVVSWVVDIIKICLDTRVIQLRVRTVAYVIHLQYSDPIETHRDKGANK